MEEDDPVFSNGNGLFWHWCQILEHPHSAVVDAMAQWVRADLAAHIRFYVFMLNHIMILMFWLAGDTCCQSTECGYGD